MSMHPLPWGLGFVELRGCQAASGARGPLHSIAAILSAAILAAATAGGCSGPVVPATSLSPQDIRATEAIRESVEALARPEMGGRPVTSPQGRQASEWIAEQMEEAGLLPDGDGGGWFECFDVDKRVLAAPATAADLLRPRLRRIQGTGRNVVGVLAATSGGGGRTIVIGAHYDHLPPTGEKARDFGRGGPPGGRRQRQRRRRPAGGRPAARRGGRSGGSTPSSSLSTARSSASWDRSDFVRRHDVSRAQRRLHGMPGPVGANAGGQSCTPSATSSGAKCLARWWQPASRGEPAAACRSSASGMERPQPLRPSRGADALLLHRPAPRLPPDDRHARQGKRIRRPPRPPGWWPARFAAWMRSSPRCLAASQRRARPSRKRLIPDLRTHRSPSAGCQLRSGGTAFGLRTIARPKGV